MIDDEAYVRLDGTCSNCELDLTGNTRQGSCPNCNTRFREIVVLVSMRIDAHR